VRPAENEPKTSRTELPTHHNERGVKNDIPPLHERRYRRPDPCATAFPNIFPVSPNPDQRQPSWTQPALDNQFGLMLGITISVVMPVSIAGSGTLKSSDWIGFAGSMIVAGMT
jgi:hypothetical protein